MSSIIITGGTKGIGFACASIFARNNYNVAICSRNAMDLEEAGKKLQEVNQNIKVFTSVCDVSKKEEIERFGNDVLAEFGTVDVLLNNAGVFFPGSIAEEETGNLETMIETNLYSAYHLVRNQLPQMKARNSGHIINMCSIASITAYENGGSYAISKFALLGMSKCLRQELKATGIKVTAILPGATWSASWVGVDLPHSRLMEAEDIAEVVFNCTQLSKSAVVEEIVIRPQLGDL